MKIEFKFVITVRGSKLTKEAVKVIIQEIGDAIKENGK